MSPLPDALGALGRAALLALALVPLAACGDPGPPPPGPAHLLGLGRSAPGRLEVARAGADAPGPALDLLTADRTWTPVSFTVGAVDLERAPVGATSADGHPALGPEAGAWVTLVPVEPGRTQALTRRFTGGDLQAVDASAKVVVLELAAAPAPGDLAPVLALDLPRHDGSAWRGGPEDPARGLLWLRTRPTTHALALVVTLDRGGDPTVETEGGPRARLESLTLAPAGAAERLVDLLDRELAPGEVPVAPFSVGMTTRRAAVIPAGGRLVLEGRAPSAGALLELALGLVPSEDDPAAPAPAASLALPGWAEAGGRRLVSYDEVHVALPAESARWSELRLRLPGDVEAGTPVRLVVEATAPRGAAADAPLGLVGEPRLVPRPAPGAERRPNVVVVSLDTLRADRMGVYGHDRPTTPRLDAFAREALVFDAAWSNGAYTLPSHMSLFTGQTPTVHGVQGAARRRDPGRSPLLAEVLRARGWTTAAFTGGGFVDPSFGFGDGFDLYATADPMVNTTSRKLAADVEQLDGVDLALLDASNMDRVVGWVEEHAAEPFFLFLHTYAAHQFDPPAEDRAALGIERELADDPEVLELLYTAGEGGREEVFARALALYDGSVRQADRGVGRLLDALDRLGLADDTLVVVTSDHGKEIGDHGALGHGHVLYEELVHVPLLVRLPRAGAGATALERGDWAPGRSSAPVSLVDVVPTILEALDLAPWDGLQGTSLLHEPPAGRRVLAEVDNLALKYALREGSLKTILSPLEARRYVRNTVELEVFDLSADPHERAPLPATAAHRAALEAAFAEARALAERLGGATRTGELDASLVGQLGHLGYTDALEPPPEHDDE